MRRKNTVIISVLLLLAASMAGTAHAQFWKRKSKRKHKQEQTAVTSSDSTTTAAPPHELTKKEKKRKEKAERKKQRKEKKHKHKDEAAAKKAAEAPKPVVKPMVKARAEITLPPTRFKPRYRIDVLAPLYLDDLVKGKYITYNDKLPDKAYPGVSFIQGVNLAADSMKRAGYNVDIYIHDNSSFQESAEILTRQGKLDATDLIIGAVPPQDIAPLADFARKKQVYFISALSAADDGVKDNPYFTILQPTLKVHCNEIVSDITKNHPHTKVTLLYRTGDANDSKAYACLTADSAKMTLQPMMCNTLPDREHLRLLTDTGGKNIVIVAISDIVYAESVLKNLSKFFPHATFEVYGMPSWDAMSDLRKPKIFPNLTVNITTAFNFDATSVSGKYIERNFQKNYGGKPSELVYRGYETLLWYANLLKSYGTMFRETDNAPAPFTPFEISPQWDSNNDLLYNENRHIAIVRYSNGNVVKE